MMIALKLFLQKNFKEVTMKEIVEVTGLSKGAFYHYFESKEQLFSEIIRMFFTSIAAVQNENITTISLLEFYNESLKNINDFSLFFVNSDTGTSEVESIFSINFFSLLFDALKMFPDFKQKMEDYHSREMTNWISVIANARKNKEIISIIDDSQLAKLFMFSSDGLALNLTLHGNLFGMKEDVKLLWDQLYNSIKN
jgi:TetR/AcrR family transcriptional regulator, transcriptional repressor for nem operon